MNDVASDELFAIEVKRPSSTEAKEQRRSYLDPSANRRVRGSWNCRAWGLLWRWLGLLLFGRRRWCFRVLVVNHRAETTSNNSTIGNRGDYPRCYPWLGYTVVKRQLGYDMIERNRQHSSHTVPLVQKVLVCFWITNLSVRTKWNKNTFCRDKYEQNKDELWIIC